jgi:tRNA(Ile)-lysidine synthase
LDKIKKTIKEFRMLDREDRIVVAVSGGIDSIVLLHALTELAAEYRLFIIVAHLNHCLRGRESDRDEVFVKRLAENLGVKYVGKRIDVRLLLKKGDSLQDIAREARYSFFDRVAKRYKADRIATGHNMDDQAETVLMKFMKGTGLGGLCGIPKVKGKYIRPLINLTRIEIEEYAERCRLQFVKDSSNKSSKYLRNSIRLKLIPILEEYNPSLKKDLARLSRILERDDLYLKDKAEGAYKTIVVRRDRYVVSMYLKRLRRLHGSLKARIFFMAVEELLGSSKGFYSYHVEDFLGLLCSDAPNLSINLPGRLMVYKEYDTISIEKRQKAGNRRLKKVQQIFFEKILRINGKTSVVADNGFKLAEFKTKTLNNKPALSETGRISHTVDQNIAIFDYDKLKFPINIRNFRPGDRFAPLGMDGHKKVKRLFQEKKISRRRRGLMPILVSGDEIIWVAGIRQADYGKIDANTKRVLKIDVYPLVL